MNLQELMSNLVISTVPADGLAPFGARASAGIMMTKFGPVYTVKCRYNAVFGVQEIDRVIAVTALLRQGPRWTCFGSFSNNVGNERY